MATATPFDPYQQNITVYTSPDTYVNIPIPAIDEWVSYLVQININYGVQIGASIILLVVLMLLTKTDKRASPIVIMNAISLVLNITRNVLMCTFFTSSFNESYAFFAGDYSRVPRGDYVTSVTTTVFEVLLLISIEASLCLQVWVVCKTMATAYRRLIFAVSAAIALTAIAFRTVYSVRNAILILQSASDIPLAALGSMDVIVTTVSICWFSAVFITKLGFALWRRKRLGLEKFGPMQILFIMGCQTLFVPVLFAILQFVSTTPSMSSEVLTAVVVFLPLSSLWAGVSLEGPLSSPTKKESRVNLLGSMRSGFSPKSPQKSSAGDRMTLQELSESAAPSPCPMGRSGSYPDIEAQDFVHEK